jgi:hypothetical protein
MLLKVETKNIFSDFDWVIRVLESSETSGQLDCVLNCFKLWETKHCDNVKNFRNRVIIKNLRAQFWALFKNKSARCRK